MIPTSGWVATIRRGDENDPRLTTAPVAGWDHGGGLILDPAGHRLVPAHEERGFVGISHVTPATVIPGDGWVADWTDSAGRGHTAPVVAWRIDADGNGTPLLAGATGAVARSDHRDLRVHHPSQVRAG